MKNKNVVIYSRGATNENFQSSVVKQQEVCRRLAVVNEHVIARVISEIGSDLNPERTGFRVLCDYVRKNKPVAVYVSSIDRISRDMEQVRHFQQLLRKYNVELVSANNSPEQTLTEAITILFTDYEHRIRLERRKAVFAKKNNCRPRA